MSEQRTSSENNSERSTTDIPAELAQAMWANAYAITYRLTGSEAHARAAADTAVHRAVTEPPPLATHTEAGWLGTVAICAVRAASAQQFPGDGVVTESGLREALRRRLERATPAEQAAGSLIHLAAYEPDYVAGLLGCEPTEAVALAGVIAPPPLVQYRTLGDPGLRHGGAAVRRSRRSGRAPRLRGPHWSTVLAALIVVVMVLAATQCTGPRPTLAPEPDEHSMSVPGEVLSENADRSPS